MAEIVSVLGDVKYNIKEKYELSYGKITEIVKAYSEKQYNEGLKENEAYFWTTGKFLLKVKKMEMSNYEDCYKERTYEELSEWNSEIYSEFLNKNYQQSYGNPLFCVEKFGTEIGRRYSFFYYTVYESIQDAYKHKTEILENNNQIFLEMIKVAGDSNECKKLDHILMKAFFDKSLVVKKRILRINEIRNVEYDFYKQIFLNRDLDDLRYLYRYGKYISKNEIQIAQYLSKVSKEQLDGVAKAIVNAFERSLKLSDRGPHKRDVVGLTYHIGNERIVKAVIEELQASGFRCTIQAIFSTEVNAQFIFDHRFDDALYFDEAFVELDVESFIEACERSRDLFDCQAGPIDIESFGEKNEILVEKDECLTYSNEQKKLKHNHSVQISDIFEGYAKRAETSFTCVTFPVPEIGHNFEQIFDSTIQINRMENERHERTQQIIIDLLDEAQYIYVKGKDGNETDMKICLAQLQNNEEQTLFCNCVADINMPLGEVYTSPMLEQTNGMIHIKEFFYGSLYKNVKLQVENGFVTNFACSNSENLELSKSYITENLFEFNEVLPIGEFAIGTNTRAYAMAKKYNIVEKLSDLFVEKMGPHFAIGDTCYSWIEDVPVYNALNGKEMIAKDNEKTRQRKENTGDAYIGMHIDLTIPYDEIAYISAKMKNGTIFDIIRNGRFVVPGTEWLNIPLETVNNR